jgi:TetR/AcrR family tetracycline transcriptional repressor
VARPKLPLIDRDEVVATALDLIDRDGLDAFSIRRLATELGVNGASLYHHFADKDAILHRVRLLILHESHVGEFPAPDEPWQDYVRRTTLGYRASLLLHPNALPLMAPTVLLRPFSLVLRDRVAAQILRDGVPPALVFPIIDSVEVLAYASALLNPLQLSPQARLPVRASDNVPSLARALRAAPRAPERLFELQLEAVIEGWADLVGPAAVSSLATSLTAPARRKTRLP